MPSSRLQPLILTAAAVVMAGVCVYGGVRLVTQGAMGWGVALTALGAWTLYKAVLGYRSVARDADARETDPRDPARETRPPR